MGLFIGRPSLSGNPGVVPLPVPFPEALLGMGVLVLSPQPVNTLQLFSIKPSFPQNSGSKASILTHGGLGGLSGSSNWPGGMQNFPPPRELSGGPYPLVCSTVWVWKVLGSSRGLLMGLLPLWQPL